MIDIKKTKFYEYVKTNIKDSVMGLPFYVDSGILITESNIKYIVETEMIDYQTKIEEVLKFKKDYPIDTNIENKITEKLKERIGLNKLNVSYVYVDSSNIDQAIEQVENVPEFVDWCVE